MLVSGLAILTLAASPALAQDKGDKHPGADPVVDKPVRSVDEAEGLAAALDLDEVTTTAVRHRPELDHMGSFNVWGGVICADELALVNPATKTASLDTVVIDKDGTKLASTVEVLEPGDSIDLVADTGTGAAITRLAKGSGSSDAVLRGSVGGDGCSDVAMLLVQQGERVSTTFATWRDASGHFDLMPIEDIFSACEVETDSGLMPIEDVFSFTSVQNTRIDSYRDPDTGEGIRDPDTGEFTLGLIVPVAMEKGYTAMGLFEGCYKYE